MAPDEKARQEQVSINTVRLILLGSLLLLGPVALLAYEPFALIALGGFGLATFLLTVMASPENRSSRGQLILMSLLACLFALSFILGQEPSIFEPEFYVVTSETKQPTRFNLLILMALASQCAGEISRYLASFVFAKMSKSEDEKANHNFEEG
ncbi:hypothetical protein [Roseibium sp. Sym1]|uniref:hypothetical protein n=1 Tax=Roseibium sp. Sym1 TaxID=3016006 RepID=UPI0022B58155|nr:hypothetical protein [Roseibium sp. Sym1]